MGDIFAEVTSACALPPGVHSELKERGFVVMPHVMSSEGLKALTAAYTAAMATAIGDDVRHGSTSTRVTDFVNRGAEFDGLYLFPALLEACGQIIGQAFKLSSFSARTLRPRSSPQELHVDVRRDSADWPLVGFILMVDEFRPDNGATRFVPGSHLWENLPEHAMADVYADHPQQELACGSAGSLLIFNGSAWHGHTSNQSDGPRRSLQGAYIPRAGQAAIDFAARMQPQTYQRLSPLARRVLSL